MRRRIVLSVAIGLAIVIGLAPLLVVYYISRDRAFEAERSHLVDYATWTMQRTDQVLGRVKVALKRLEMEQHTLCSPEHLARLRQVTIDVLSLKSIEVVRDGRLLCDSWGLADEGRPMPQPDVRFSDGFGLTLETRPMAASTSGMVILSHGSYQAHVKKESLVDVLHDTPMTLGIATLDGTPIATSGQPDPQIAFGFARPELPAADGQRFFSSVMGTDLMAFATSSHSIVDWRVDDELWRLIPVGIIISATLILVIAWVSRQRLSPSGELTRGIQKREFVAHYQPIMELATGRCIGAEALVRWPRVDGPWVGPDVFIPLAEQTRQIDRITDLMIERVIEDMGEALTANPDMHIAINISPQDIEGGRFHHSLERAVRASGIGPSQIWLEVTERGFMNPDIARQTLDKARAAGHLVGIDDFGTGYSSLSLLETLPLHVIKIDKCFIDAIGHEAAISVVTPHIIGMAHDLDCRVIAEGVETREQAEYLRAAGVQFAQGWLYSKALPPADFLRFFDRRNSAPVLEAVA